MNRYIYTQRLVRQVARTVEAVGECSDQLDKFKIAEELLRELTAAQSEHKAFRNAHEAYAVLLEEVDEFWEEVKKKSVDDGSIARNITLNCMRKELIQIGAMAMRSLLDLNLLTEKEGG